MCLCSDNSLEVLHTRNGHHRPTDHPPTLTNGPFPDYAGSKEAGTARGSVPWGEGEFKLLSFNFYSFSFLFLVSGCPGMERDVIVVVAY